ncbi:MAG: FtsW/RodA/SpoVE family cell cycle protein [Acidobacteriota bacterium]|nr:FtsW/RodA/SpoVE family cell cycle protein [Acidobacteriota bacterium]
MRVISPAAATRVRPEVRRSRAVNLEFAGMIAASAIVVFGLALVFGGKLARVAEDGPVARLVQLASLEDAQPLEPRLTMFPTVYERQAALKLIAQRIERPPRLEHVGGLASITIPAEDVRADKRLVLLNERLARRPQATSVALFTPSDIGSLKPRLAIRTEKEFVRRSMLAFGSLLAAFWLAHLVRRWRRRDDDPVLLPAVLLLCGVGVMAMVGLRDPLRDTMAASVFVGGVVAGLLVLLLAAEFDYEGSPLRRAVILPLAAALALALALLLFGSGPGSSGVKVNLLGMQPVEAIRLLVVFGLAAYFGRRIEFLRALSQPATAERPWLRYLRVPRWKDVGPIFVSMGIVLAFFFFQKDLGPALVLTCVFLALYGIGRGHVALVLTGFGLLLGGFALAYMIGQPATVRQRVLIWADPWNNGVPGGNQIAHGLWALSTGGAWGSGPGLGSPQMVPAGHTDFVLAAVGEELGFIGLVAIVLLYGILAWRCLRVALRAPGDYSAFLAVGVALGLVVQLLVIAGGLLGLAPLSGVVTPFLSYGRSSMLANCFAVGVVLAIAQRRGQPRAHLRAPIRTLAGVLLAAGLVVLLRGAWIQVVHADDVAAAASVSEQADGGYRFEHNPRLLAAARGLERGTIYDRNGLPLATSRPDETASIAKIYRAAGISSVSECDPADSRCYPLGGFTFHLLGDWNTQTNWAAGNSSYLERDSDAQLKGYDDHAREAQVVNPRTGKSHAAISRDYRELLPLIRQRHWPRSSAINALRARTRDVHTSIDARLQIRAAAALRHQIAAGKSERGAAVVLDPSSGEVLASVSYPWPAPGANQMDGIEAEHRRAQLLDRARYGLYPPGSVFKLVIAGAALRRGGAANTFSCQRLPDGRVGNYVRGVSRPVRDDPMDTVPHGSTGLHHGLVVSCNAYFAQLAQELGPKVVLDAASVFQIDVSRPQTAAALTGSLPHAGYGQGQVVVSPLKMARVSGAIAAGGRAAQPRWILAEPGTSAEGARFLSSEDASRLGRAMRDVVLDGTGRAVKGNRVAIAGKTGTAEIAGAAAHSWFTGFAPYGGSGPQIAFAVVVENAGYGARAAAPVAGEIVTAAKDLGLIK